MPFTIDIERLIHSIKTAIACLIGVGIVKLIGFGADQWVLISIIVVMCAQLYVGSVIQKSLLRFIGTAFGCFIAAATILLLGTDDTTIAIGIALSSFIFSYFATANEILTYTGTLGAATTAIILLNPTPTLDVAILRFLEITLGIAIATFTSQFILPITARSHLRRNQAKTLTQLRDYYKVCMLSQTTLEKDLEFEDFDETIVKLLSKQRVLAKEAKQEPFRIAFDVNLFVQSLQCEKEILRAVDFMHHALLRIRKVKQPFTVTQAMIDFNTTVINVFNALIKAIEKDGESKVTLTFPEMTVLKSELQTALQSHEQPDPLYIDGYLFAVEILVRSLKTLCALFKIAQLTEHN